jgi:hypothetical protein
MVEHVIGDAPDEAVDVHADTRRAKGTTSLRWTKLCLM